MNSRHTPWGASHGCVHIADGIEFHDTAGHGGFWVSPERFQSMPEPLRLADSQGDTSCTGAWFEEDVDWCMVALAFPSAFSEAETSTAEELLRNWRPERWEALRGRVLQPGESHVKDQREFDRVHALDWVVIRAYGTWSPNVPTGFVGVDATAGGQRGDGVRERRWLVPAAEYAARGGSFVVDPSRHRPVAGHFGLGAAVATN